MLKIIRTPNKVLTTPVKEVKNIDQRIKKLIKEMQDTLVSQKNPEGVGLAATQVGVDLAIFIIKPTKESQVRSFINPKILEIQDKEPKKNPKKQESLEGCLSIPRVWSPVRRPQKILLEYQDINGEKQKEWFSGFEAIIIQHEVDHLQGVLFTQRALEKKIPLYAEQDGKLEPIEF